MTRPTRPSVILACPGLDHAHRGFETFARECYEALRNRPELQIELVKGTGPQAPGELVVRTFTRDSPVAKRLAGITSRDPFVIEHVLFALALLPLLARKRPDVVYFSEWHFGRVLGAWRRVSRRSFGLVLCNGALVAEGYEHLDRVQQLVPGAIEFAEGRGEDPHRQVFLPLGVAIEPSPALNPEDLGSLRRRLDLPLERRIVLSAGAINRQKRMDYLVEEIARMPAPRPFLLLLGQQEAETPEIERLARQRLGEEGCAIRTVSPRSMPDHYRVSDCFVLASLWESFGRVLVEAQSHGLPCLAHDYPVMEWVLGEEGQTADLCRPGSVSGWLDRIGEEDFSLASRERRRQAAHARFSWDVLAPRYAEMLGEVARGRGPRV